MSRSKMPDDKKVKLIYSGEIFIFAIIFATIAILKMVGVLPYKEIIRIIFNWISLFGGLWLIADFIWLMCSKRRRKKNSVLDKALFLPLGIYIITYDLICLIGPKQDDKFYIFMISGALLYVSVVYIFEAIYHYFRPIPSIVSAIEQIQKEQEEQPEEAPAEETENKEKEEENESK